MARRVRARGLTLALVLAACGTQAVVTSPSPSPAPSPSSAPTATPVPTNATTDVVYLRHQKSGGAPVISVIDARTGALRREAPDGVVSRDTTLHYSMESADGGARTVVHVQELGTGREARSFNVDGDLRMTFADDGPDGLTEVGDGRALLTLSRTPSQLDGKWITRFVVVDAVSGALAGRTEMRSASRFGYVAVSPDGRRLYLNEFGEGATRLRAYDLSSQAFLPEDALGRDTVTRQQGFRTRFVRSADGRRLFALDAGKNDGPFVLALDIVTGRASRIALPPDQLTTDFEKYLLWSLVLTPDGSALYAVNPAIGVVDEIDTGTLALRRTAQITVSRRSDDPLARLGRLLFPVAEAKRYLRGGAALSPDGRTLYAAGNKGIAVVDLMTLDSRAVWLPDAAFGSIALSPDGARLYAIDDEARSIAIVDAREGSQLGAIPYSGYANRIVRIDTDR